MRIALAQLNLTVGDIPGNTAKIIAAIQKARAQKASVLLTPELSVIGYPPRDLLLKPHLITLCAQAVQTIADASIGITTLVGYPEKNLTSVGRPLHNAVAVVRDGKILTKHFKSLLPTYDVFDESRYFEPGPTLPSQFQPLESQALSPTGGGAEKEKTGGVQEGSTRGQGGVNLEITPPKTDPSSQLNTGITFIDDHVVGLSICEDLWNDEQMLPRTLYHNNPIESLARAGARILFNISASPFAVGKNNFRHQLFAHQAKRWQMPIVYVNQVGANDELIFDGNSVVFNKDGQILAQAKDFEEDLLIVDLNNPDPGPRTPEPAPRSPISSIHSALLLGIRDYVQKCNFKTVVLGLSGGIDSAVVAALAAQALGPQNVHGIALPSRYSSDHSIADAKQLAENLGIHFQILPINEAHTALEHTLAPIFAAAPANSSDIAEQNVQARVRGNLLMALSNKFGHLLLTTGNKSEIATGYCTLYGDMCGGLAVISDVPKMMVYELANYINTQYSKPSSSPVLISDAANPIPHTPYPIPQNSITKPPSAELRPDQKDQDSLPPYPVLDAILQAYVEEEKSPAEIITQGFDANTVQRVTRMVDLNEYKRKQMPPGLKVTSRAFGIGRRMPIAARFL